MKLPYILLQPIAKWESLLSKLDTHDTQQLEHELSSLIQRATLLEAYVSHRFNTGCGDQGHMKSAKKANKVLVHVRRALGYSYPGTTPLYIP